ncbi:MAG: hypothetical protein U9R43_05525 [Thermodesulfobacteriota bacterium]|nr:hypothetical protein [Thermodesulfobacteriota bacterium]
MWFLKIGFRLRSSNYAETSRQDNAPEAHKSGALMCLVTPKNPNRRRVNIKKGDAACSLSPKGQKWYLLNKLFGLRPSEISELEGIDKKNSSVRQLFIKTADQRQAGELSLIEVTPKEKKAAKARLDTQRKKRREHYTEMKYK